MTQDSDADARAALIAELANLAIPARIDAYPAHSTVDEGKALRGDLPGTFTKNLLLKDKKKRLYLLSVHEDRTVNLKGLHRVIGASGQVRFAGAAEMRDHLGVAPGALTPLAVFRDRAEGVTVVLDGVLMVADWVNFHPMTQTETIRLSPDELRRYLTAVRHEPVIADLTGTDHASA